MTILTKECYENIACKLLFGFYPNKNNNMEEEINKSLPHHIRNFEEYKEKQNENSQIFEKTKVFIPEEQKSWVKEQEEILIESLKKRYKNSI